MREVYEPKGLPFFDNRSGREMLLVYDEGPWKNWICYRHPDGQWVSLRESTEKEREQLHAALVDAHHKGH